MVIVCKLRHLKIRMVILSKLAYSIIHKEYKINVQRIKTVLRIITFKKKIKSKIIVIEFQVQVMSLVYVTRMRLFLYLLKSFENLFSNS